MATYIIGDIHGDVQGLKMAIDAAKVPENSTIILLGDVALNYYGDGSDVKRKKFLAKLPYLFLCVHGNHEMRPWEAEGYSSLREPKFPYGNMFWEEKRPTIIFLDDGIHHIEDKKVLVLGGAYSVDKFHRLARGSKWWESEQMSQSRRDAFLEQVKDQHFDVVLSHTCPYMARPLEKGLSFIDQATVDNTMEVFLERMRGQITYDKWYAGHWHIDEVRKDEGGEVHFLFKHIVEIK